MRLRAVCGLCNRSPSAGAIRLKAETDREALGKKSQREGEGRREADKPKKRQA